VVGGSSIDDVWVSFGSTEVHYGQIRMKLVNVYADVEMDTDGENGVNGENKDVETQGKWEALLLKPVRPFRWEQRSEVPVEI
jgi:hypothetical protein